MSAYIDKAKEYIENYPLYAREIIQNVNSDDKSVSFYNKIEEETLQFHPTMLLNKRYSWLRESQVGMSILENFEDEEELFDQDFMDNIPYYCSNECTDLIKYIHVYHYWCFNTFHKEMIKYIFTTPLDEVEEAINYYHNTNLKWVLYLAKESDHNNYLKIACHSNESSLFDYLIEERYEVTPHIFAELIINCNAKVISHVLSKIKVQFYDYQNIFDVIRSNKDYINVFKYFCTDGRKFTFCDSINIYPRIDYEAILMVDFLKEHGLNFNLKSNFTCTSYKNARKLASCGILENDFVYYLHVLNDDLDFYLKNKDKIRDNFLYALEIAAMSTSGSLIFDYILNNQHIYNIEYIQNNRNYDNRPFSSDLILYALYSKSDEKVMKCVKLFERLNVKVSTEFFSLAATLGMNVPKSSIFDVPLVKQRIFNYDGDVYPRKYRYLLFPIKEPIYNFTPTSNVYHIFSENKEDEDYDETEYEDDNCHFTILKLIEIINNDNYEQFCNTIDDHHGRFEYKIIYKMCELSENLTEDTLIKYFEYLFSKGFVITKKMLLDSLEPLYRNNTDEIIKLLVMNCPFLEEAFPSIKHILIKYVEVMDVVKNRCRNFKISEQLKFLGLEFNPNEEINFVFRYDSREITFFNIETKELKNNKNIKYVSFSSSYNSYEDFLFYHGKDEQCYLVHCEDEHFNFYYPKNIDLKFHFSVIPGTFIPIDDENLTSSYFWEITPTDDYLRFDQLFSYDFIPYRVSNFLLDYPQDFPKISKSLSSENNRSITCYNVDSNCFITTNFVLGNSMKFKQTFSVTLMKNDQSEYKMVYQRQNTIPSIFHRPDFSSLNVCTNRVSMKENPDLSDLLSADELEKIYQYLMSIFKLRHIYELI